MPARPPALPGPGPGRAGPCAAERSRRRRGIFSMGRRGRSNPRNVPRGRGLPPPRAAAAAHRPPPPEAPPTGWRSRGAGRGGARGGGALGGARSVRRFGGGPYTRVRGASRVSPAAVCGPRAPRETHGPLPWGSVPHLLVDPTSPDPRSGVLKPLRWDPAPPSGVPELLPWDPSPLLAFLSPSFGTPTPPPVLPHPPPPLGSQPPFAPSSQLCEVLNSHGATSPPILGPQSSIFRSQPTLWRSSKSHGGPSKLPGGGGPNLSMGSRVSSWNPKSLLKFYSFVHGQSKKSHLCLPESLSLCGVGMA